MENVNQLLEIDWVQTFYNILLIMVGITAVVVIVAEFFDKVLKRPFRWWKSMRKDHTLLESTITELKSLSERHEKDVMISNKHDEEIKETLESFMDEMRAVVIENKKDISQFYENRVKDREQSFKVQKELTDTQKKLSDIVDKIDQKIDIMKNNTDTRFKENEEKQNERVQAELKDKIGQSYRYYHARKKINDIELEALEGLIKAYEGADGRNSFVHSLVQKEMYTWEKVERE